ncbi:MULTISPECIES: hypothetical protein [unclassified Streptomyces]|uniref:hypothetical protein n=1 Tax=unclassified Streptomyces TaxID=2593676 RepID=UPI000969A430|nr:MULTISPECIES: hypothetical protein [unclassified Streptomyces]MCD2465281.1 hypothetical protein [Streptomyces sp. MBT42]OKJ60197.1 hypothetical protein AMK27_22480 [Streptomyces sp. CB02009]
MTATTFTLVTTVTRPRVRPLSTALRAIRAFGGAAAGVVLLGDYGPPEAGVRNPRPEYAPGPD